MTRFFVAPDAIADGRVLFGADDSHHIAVVLKLRAGEQVVALPNDGSAHAAILETVAKSRCEARIVASARPQTEPRVSVTVAQALPKTLEKLEWVLQHGTEIGVARFVLFTGARSRADGDRLERKIERWRQIVRTAAEQSGRARLPEVVGLVTLARMLSDSQSIGLRLLAYEAEQDATLRAALRGDRPSSVLLAVGPEGGFSPAEAREAEEAGLQPITLGPRILRTETAALTAVSQILYALDADGDCGAQMVL